MARLQLDRRGRGQVPGDISQNPRQGAQLGYGGLQEGVVTLELPCVRVCVCVWRRGGFSIKSNQCGNRGIGQTGSEQVGGEREERGREETK